MIEIQTEPIIDNMINGHEMTKLPYPFFVDEAGAVARQDFWRGDPLRVVGFQRDLAVHVIDLWWSDALEDLSAATGMYLVTENTAGDWGVHQSAVRSAEVIGDVG